MQDNLPTRLLVTIILITSMVLAVMYFTSCTTTKKTTTTKTEVTKVTETVDSLRLLKEENAALKSELRQMQYAGVVFDSTRCPRIAPVIINGCNNDSVNSLVAFLNSRISQYNDIIDGMGNKIEILSDGTIKAAGLIKSANYSNEVSKRIIATWQAKYDSLLLSKSKVQTVVKIKFEDRYIKRSFIPWWVWLVCGVFLFLYVRERFGGLSNVKFFGTNK